MISHNFILITLNALGEVEELRRAWQNKGTMAQHLMELKRYEEIKKDAKTIHRAL